MYTAMVFVAFVVWQCVRTLYSPAASPTLEWGSVADWFSGLATVAAVIVALNANRITRSRQLADDAVARRIDAEQITLKLASIGDDLMVLRAHTVERVRTVRLQTGAEIIQRSMIDPVFGHPNETVPRLTPSEASALIAVGAVNQAMKFNLISKRMTSHQASLNEYARQIELYEASLPHPSRLVINDGVRNDETELQGANGLEIQRRLADLESFSSHLRDYVARDLVEAADLADSLGPFLQALAPGQKVVVPDTSALRANPNFPFAQAQ
ncbi:hypothetical protein QP178_16815 [Sphingomonas aurantiaca]|uniref:hypothetical protein n=1 Tax=Sphingomonas aurantiaca TaxID=185949 RepID=UPI002FE13759